MNTEALPFVVLPRAERARVGVANAVMLLASMGAIAWTVMALPGWIAMWVMATALFLGLKLVVLWGYWHGSSLRRLAAFLLLWPGMNAAAFLANSRRLVKVDAREGAFACGKLALGLGLAGWAVRHADTSAPLVVAWVGMLGIIFTFHFGLFHVASCAWRAAGVDAPPIMRVPIAARSLAEFWASAGTSHLPRRRDD